MKYLVRKLVLLLVLSSVAARKIIVNSPINIDGTRPVGSLEYEIIEGISTGEGNCGKIIVAKDAFQKWVVIKLVNPLESDGTTKSAAVFNYQLTTLRNEFVAYQYLFKMANNAYSAGIAEAYCSGIGKTIEGDETKYELIVMAYYPKTLTKHANLLREHHVFPKRLSQVKSIGYTLEILEIMEFLKLYNMVHHDIKPDNLMLDNDGKLRLIDFGFACFPGAKLDRMGRRGTALYQHMDDWDWNYPGSSRRNDFMPFVYTMLEFEVGYKKLEKLVIEGGKGATEKDKNQYELSLGNCWWLPYSKRNFTKAIEKIFLKEPKLGGIVLKMHAVAAFSTGEIDYTPHKLLLQSLEKELLQNEEIGKTTKGESKCIIA